MRKLLFSRGGGKKSLALHVASALATLAIAASIPATQASSLFDANFVTDAGQSFSGSANFTFVSNGVLQVTLTDTTAHPVSDATNIADLAFSIPGLTSGTVTGASGATIAGITSGGSGTLGSYSGASPWDLTNASGSGSGWWNQNGLVPAGTDVFDLYAPAGSGSGSGCLPNTAPDSVVGGSNGSYGAATGSIGSANPLIGACDGTMFYQSVTFNLAISGLTSTNFATISHVTFGLGPDGANTPDGDDVGAGVFQPQVSGVPEPASFVLLGLGICWIGLGRLRSRSLLRLR